MLSNADSLNLMHRPPPKPYCCCGVPLRTICCLSLGPNARLKLYAAERSALAAYSRSQASAMRSR